MVWFSHRRLFLFSLLGSVFVIGSLFLAIPLHVAAANATWVPVPTPKQPKTYNTLFGIASISSTDVWTVGNTSTTSSANSLIEHWDGRSWKIIPAAQVNPGQEALDGVAAVSHNDVWAVGATLSSSRALIEHWNGKRWSAVPAPAPPPPNDSYSLSAVTALSSTDVWAVGYHVFFGGQQSLALHWDGTAWSVIPTPTITQGGVGSPADDALSSITAISSHDIWASGSLNYGNQGLIEHWDGTSWNVVPSPAPSTISNLYTLNSIAADASGHVWAVGQDLNAGLPLIEQWTGTSWMIVSSPPPPTIGSGERSSLSGVTAVSGTSVWAVGSYGASTSSNTYISDTLVEHWDGTAWTIVPSPNVNPVNALNAVTSFDGQTGAVGFSQTANHISTLVIGCNCA